MQLTTTPYGKRINNRPNRLRFSDQHGLVKLSIVLCSWENTSLVVSFLILEIYIFFVAKTSLRVEFASVSDYYGVVYEVDQTITS